MKRITNLSLEQVVLKDGTILGASGSEGSSKVVESVVEADLRRLGDKISVKDARDDRPGPVATAGVERTAPADGVAKTKVGELGAAGDASLGSPTASPARPAGRGGK